MAVTPITINIDNTVLNRIITDLSSSGGYQAQIPDPNNPKNLIPNTQTAAQFAKQMLISYIITTCKNYEQQQAVQTAAQGVQTINSNLLS